MTITRSNPVLPPATTRIATSRLADAVRFWRWLLACACLLLPLAAVAAGPVTVQWASPAANAVVAGTTQLRLTGSNLVNVEIFRAGVMLVRANVSSDGTSATAAIDTTKFADGPLALTAHAWNVPAGQVSTSDADAGTRTFNIANKVSLKWSAPAANATVSGVAPLKLTGTNLVNVEIFRNGSLLTRAAVAADRLSASASIDVSQFADGPLTLTAHAWNVPAGQVSTSDADAGSLTLNVANKITLKWATPATGSTVSRTATFTLTGTNLVNAEIFKDGAMLVRCAISADRRTATASIDTTRFANGALTLTAHAWNVAAGQVSTSDADAGSLTVNVANTASIVGVPLGTGAGGNLKRAQSFWDASGTNTHFHYRPPYTNPAQSAWADDTKLWNMIGFLNPLGPASGLYIFREDLIELGYGVNYTAIIDRLGQAGYRFIWYPGWSNNGGNGWDFSSQGSNMVKYTDKGYTFAIEGPNEVENGFGGTPLNQSSYKAKNGNTYYGAQAPVMWQADLWDTFGPGSKYKLPVILFTNGNGSNSQAEQTAGQQLGRPLNAISNRGSCHYYANSGLPVGAGSPPQMEYDCNTQTSMTGGINGYPVAVTEMGFRNLTNDAVKIGTPQTNGTYIPEMFFDHYKRGFFHASQYALVDDDSGSGFESSWGIFDYNGNARQAAVALRWIAGIMGDTGANKRSFWPGNMNVSVSGLPTYGRWLAFQRSNGDAFVVVWTNDTLLSSSGQIQTPPVRSVTVNLGGTYTDVTVYDPIKGSASYAGSNYLSAPAVPAPVATFRNVSSVPLSLQGGLQIIRIAHSQ